MALILPPLLCLLLSCGFAEGDDEPKKDKNGWTLPSEIVVNVTADNFCQELAKVACAAMHECCGAEYAADVDWGSYLSNQDDCRLFARLDCENYLGSELAGVKRGAVRLDEDKASRCLEELLPMNTQCFEYVSSGTHLPSCEGRPFQGLLTAGMACPGQVECAPGFVCGPSHECVAIPGPGALCLGAGGSPMCSAGLYCGEKGICRKNPREGEACAVGARCFDGLYCEKLEEGKPGRCAVKRKSGEPCSADEECEAGECSGLCGELEEGRWMEGLCLDVTNFYWSQWDD